MLSGPDSGDLTRGQEALQARPFLERVTMVEFTGRLIAWLDRDEPSERENAQVHAYLSARRGLLRQYGQDVALRLADLTETEE